MKSIKIFINHFSSNPVLSPVFLAHKPIDNYGNLSYIKAIYISETRSNSLWVNGLPETHTTIGTDKEPLDYGPIELIDHDDQPEQILTSLTHLHSKLITHP